MSEQDGRQAPTTQRPANDDKEAWKAYWNAQGQPWRTQPEIDPERQEELKRCLATEPDIEKGTYPFKDMKLSRADVEWLLATLENGRGPVDWEDKSQRNRKGLDLRGADLSQKDLSGLPLACIQGGLTSDEWLYATHEQSNMSVVQMGKADLVEAQLQGTDLYKAQLQGAHLAKTQLQEAHLVKAQLQGADLRDAQLQEAYLTAAKLQGADLRAAKLQGAHLVEAQLQGADLRRAELDGVGLYKATLSYEKYGSALLTDIRWGEVNLAVVDWTTVKMLGDEHLAHQTKAVADYGAAVRANRQLAVVLRDQGLNEEADRFAYRAQVLQREVWRRQHRYLKYVGSWLLWLLAGHGYRPLRSILWYLAIVIGFALTYYTFGHLSLWPPDAFVYSLTSFHGRGFFLALKESPLCTTR